MPTTPSLHDRPLVVRCGAFGDMVLITALIRGLSERFACDVDVLTSGSWSRPLLLGQPGVGEVMAVRSRKTPYWMSLDQQRAVRWLRRRGAGPTWYCDGNEAARSMLVRAGVGAEFIVDVRDHPLLEHEHATQQWRRMARILPRAGVSPTVIARMVPASARAGEGGCVLDVAERERAELQRWLEERELGSAPLLAVQMGNKRTMRRGLRRLAVNTKHWPAERWAVLLRHLRARHPDHAIVLLGAPPEYGLNQDVMARAGIVGLHNLADDLPVPRLVALLARAGGLVTVDSGPAHAAAAVGCPLVVLFGKASVALYRPWGVSGADVQVLTGEVDGAPSMLGIATDEVIAAWDRLRLRPL